MHTLNVLSDQTCAGKLGIMELLLVFRAMAGPLNDQWGRACFMSCPPGPSWLLPISPPCCGTGRQVSNVLSLTLSLNLLGAGVRHSAHGKGHEEGGSTYAKAGSSLRSSPGNPQASTPITRACLLYYFVLSPTPLTLWGAVPPPPLLEKKLT